MSSNNVHTGSAPFEVGASVEPIDRVGLRISAGYARGEQTDQRPRQEV
jgi:hypothetical protein